MSQAGPSGVQSLGPTSQEELPVIFFERAKRVLEARDVYDDFLKLLNMYTRDIIDLKTLVIRAEKFLADDTLINQFKGLVNWDNRIGNVNYGPPGSIRTGPHDATLPRPVDDAESPSYRRLPESVSGGILVYAFRGYWLIRLGLYAYPGNTAGDVRAGPTRTLGAE